MRTKLLLVVAFVVVAALSFWAGLYAAGITNPIAVLSGSAGSLSGQITALSATSLSVRADNGSITTFAIDQNAPVPIFESAPQIPKALRDLSIGSFIVVILDQGKPQMIQISSISPAPVATSSIPTSTTATP